MPIVNVNTLPSACHYVPLIALRHMALYKCVFDFILFDLKHAIEQDSDRNGHTYIHILFNKMMSKTHQNMRENIKDEHLQ